MFSIFKMQILLT